MQKLRPFLFYFVFFVLCACFYPSHLKAEQQVHAANAMLKIGVVIPLTGDFAKFGLDIQRGMNLAQEELKSRGVGIQLIFEDTQYLPRVAVTAAQKLFEIDNVNVLVSLWDTAEAVAPLAERAKVPHFSIRWNPHVAEQFAHTFTFESTYITWVRELIEFLKSEKAEKVSLMTDSSAAAWIMACESFLKQSATAGITVINDVQFAGAGDDLKTSIPKLLAKPGDYIVMLHYEPTLGDIMRRLKSFPVKTPITGYFEGMEGTENTEGRKFVAQFDTRPWFYEKFATRFPSEKPIKAAFGYDLVMILGQLLEEKGKVPTSAEILAHLNALRSHEGATGTISANQTRNIETTCVRKEIRDGKAVAIQ